MRFPFFSILIEIMATNQQPEKKKSMIGTIILVIIIIWILYVIVSWSIQGGAFRAWLLLGPIEGLVKLLGLILGGLF